MHIYRRKARNLAWYDQEGEPSTHNPFKKFRASPRRSSSIKLENRHTSDDLRMSEERRRRRDMTSGLEGLEHAETFPAEPSAATGSGAAAAAAGDRSRERDAFPMQPLPRPGTALTAQSSMGGFGESYRNENDSEAPEPSMRSHEPINVSFGDEGKDRALSSEQGRGSGGGKSSGEAGEGKPRKRRNLLGKFTDRPEDYDEEAASTSTDPVDSTGKRKFTVGGQLKATVFNSWINILILAAPVGIVLGNLSNIGPIPIFVVNFIAIVPLAAMLSYATEEVALRVGETLGGLLNATFGNAVELIVAIIALVKNEVVIVQTSLIGSMLSNLLLVMGMCFFFGGLNRLEQHFNPVVAQTAASLLALAVGSLIIPTAFHNWSQGGSGTSTNVAPLSRGTSIMLLVVYACYLLFQLKTHTEIYNRPSPKVEKRRVKVAEGDASRGIAQIGKMSASMAGQNAHQMKLHDPENDDEEEEPQLHIYVAFLTLAVSTALVAVCAEYMVNSIDGLTSMYPISDTFVGLILLPIVGNAAEHATAVTVAIKDKMDLAIGVAVGSSMQIALLVLPLIVVIGWGMGNDSMTLDLDGFQVILLFVSVLLVNYLIADGKSHWLEGVLLMMMYLIIAVAAWFYEVG